MDAMTDYDDPQDTDFGDDFDYTPPEPTRERKGKARERIEKRRQTQAVPRVEGANTSITPRNRVSQVEVEGRRRDFKLSDLPIQSLRLIAYAVGAVILVVGVIIGLGLFKDDEVVAFPNALWVGTEWTYDERTDEEVAAFAQQLREHRIGTIYAWVSWLNGENQWAGNSDGLRPFSDRQSSVLRFVSQIQAVYPELTLYGWIGLPVTGVGIEYRLNDTAVQDEMAKFSQRVVTEFGFDGVFLNIEPVWNNNSLDFIQMLNRVRLEIGDEALIAVAIPPDWTPVGVNIPQPTTIVPGTVWETRFKQQVALLTDEMAVMAYNSGLNSPFDYIPWTAYQVQVYAEAVAEINGGADVLIGIPSYDDDLPGHIASVENVSSALSGVLQGVQQAGDAASVVRGVAIYMGTFTDDTEWLQFKQGWTR
jgi:hypothetical protein